MKVLWQVLERFRYQDSPREGNVSSPGARALQQSRRSVAGRDVWPQKLYLYVNDLGSTLGTTCPADTLLSGTLVA